MTTAHGLLINGKLVTVDGLVIYAPASHGGPEYARLNPGDYRERDGAWLRQLVAHSTGGRWPQPILPGAGRPGHAKQILDMWDGADRGGGELVHSAAQLVVDYDGSIVCACDIVRRGAYHAEGSNPHSVGIEMSTMPDGSIYEATLDATARLVAALTWSGMPGAGLLPIPFQMPRGPYRNQPLRRMEFGSGRTRRQLGGPNLVGVVGHRDNTSERGYGDPGNEIFRRLTALGCEGLDYDGLEDIALGKQRQAYLNSRGARLAVDGVCGPGSIAAMERMGYKRWRDVGMVEQAA